MFNRFGIEVLGISSDGDERPLKAMKSITELDLTTTSDFRLLSLLGPISVQDMIHIATKLRNRLLNTSIFLQMGNMVVTVAHIIMILSIVPKGDHGLVRTDICPEDRQNYSSFVKITEQRVLQSLENHIPDSKATVMYLFLCKQISSSFLAEDLEAIERVYRIWYAVYFLRCWRQFIQSPDNDFTLSNNFISTNAYACVELNAHALINLIRRLRTNDQTKLFLPLLFSSQPCEQTFRHMRSMGTANFTKINFTLNELLHLIARVEVMNNIIHDNKDISFPRTERKSKEAEQMNTEMSLPNDEELLNTMKRAKNDALRKAAEFDIQIGESEIEMCKIDVSESLIEEDFMSLLEESMASGESSQDGETGNFVEVIDPDGSTKKIRKSTLIWLLSESKDKLSSDRLKRVQGGSESLAESGARKTKRFKANTSADSNISQHLFKAEVLEIGEWALFKFHREDSEEISDQNTMENYIIGMVVGFTIDTKKENGGMKHKRQCKSNIVFTDPKSDKKANLSDGEVIQVLGVWYTCDTAGVLHLIHNKMRKPIYIVNYVATMKSPISKSLSYELPCEYSELKSTLRQILDLTECSSHASMSK